MVKHGPNTQFRGGPGCDLETVEVESGHSMSGFRNEDTALAGMGGYQSVHVINKVIVTLHRVSKLYKSYRGSFSLLILTKSPSCIPTMHLT